MRDPGSMLSCHLSTSLHPNPFQSAPPSHINVTPRHDTTLRCVLKSWSASVSFLSISTVSWPQSRSLPCLTNHPASRSMAASLRPYHRSLHTSNLHCSTPSPLDAEAQRYRFWGRMRIIRHGCSTDVNHVFPASTMCGNSVRDIHSWTRLGVGA